MTAIRVVDEHSELSGSGVVTHDQIDEIVNNVTFIYVSGSSYSLSNARRIVAGPGISIVDNGPGGDLVVKTAPSPGSTISWLEVVSGSVDGVNSNFSIQNTPYPTTSLMFFVNGVLQRQGFDCDYQLSGTLITLVYPPRSGSNLSATYPY